MGSQRVDMTKQLNFLFFPFKEKTLGEGLKPAAPQSAERLERGWHPACSECLLR